MTDKTAGVGPVERGVGRPAPERAALPEPRCPYCGNLDSGWRLTDLLRGKRYKPNLLEYHCQSAFFGAQ